MQNDTQKTLFPPTRKPQKIQISPQQDNKQQMNSNSVESNYNQSAHMLKKQGQQSTLDKNCSFSKRAVMKLCDALLVNIAVQLCACAAPYVT